MLKIGDIIFCIVNNVPDITYGKGYIITDTINNSSSRNIDYLHENDICIIADNKSKWWFGQVGCSEPWTMFFCTELVWKRDNKINDILNGQTDR